MLCDNEIVKKNISRGGFEVVTIAMLGFLLCIIGVGWFIVSIIRKKRFKVPAYLLVGGVSLIIISVIWEAVSMNASSVANVQDKDSMYKVNITSVKSEPDSDSWKIKGTTNAPDNYYVLGIPIDSIDDTSQVITDQEKINIEKIHKNHFTAYVSGIETIKKTTIGQKGRVYIAAVSPKLLSKKAKNNLDAFVNQKISQKIQKHGTKKTFTLTKSQVKYIKSLNTSTKNNKKKSSSHSHQFSSTTDSYQLISINSYSHYGKKYIGKKVEVQGTVFQTQNYHGGTLIDLTDSNYSHDIVVQISKSQKSKMSYSPQEDDVVDVYGIGQQGFESINNSNNTKTSMNGIIAKKIILVK